MIQESISLKYDLVPMSLKYDLGRLGRGPSRACSLPVRGARGYVDMLGMITCFVSMITCFVLGMI